MRRRIRHSTAHKSFNCHTSSFQPPREIIVIMSSSPSPTTNESPLISNASSSPKLQWVNVVNAVAYLVNVIVVFGTQYSDRFPSNADQSEKYQTLLSPAAYAFSIWGVIFPAQAIWTVTQLLPEYRSQELVVKGVGYNYALVCAAQAAWSILFAKDEVTWSLIAMLSILLPLIKIVWTLSQIDDSTTPPTATLPTSVEGETHVQQDSNSSSMASKFRDNLLFRFPFEIHAAWITAATLVNFNVVLVAWDVSVSTRSILAWVSLFTVLGVAVSCLLLKGTGQDSSYKNNGNSQWVVPSVLTWAVYAIGKELNSPKELISKTYAKQDIEMFKIGAFVVAYTLISLLHVKFIYHKVAEKRSATSRQETSEEFNDTYEALDDNPDNL